MSWKKVGKTVGKIAPMIGTILGGPSGSAIGSVIASVLGVENTPSAVAQALKTNPEAAVKLQELEYKNSEKLRDHVLKVIEAELADKQNARLHHKDSWMPAIICCSLTVIVGIGLYLIFKLDIPEANKEIAYMAFGAVFAKWGDSVAYWVGTTRSSAVKTSILAQQ